MYVSVGTEIALHRRALGLSMRAYCRELSLAQPALVNLEAHRTYPSHSTLAAYARLARRPLQCLVAQQTFDQLLASAMQYLPPVEQQRAIRALVNCLEKLKGPLPPPQLTAEGLCRLQAAPHVAWDIITADPTLAATWTYAVSYVIHRPVLSAYDSQGRRIAEKADISEPEVVIAAAVLSDGHIRVAPRIWADLLRLCCSDIDIAPGPGAVSLRGPDGILIYTYQPAST